jgi:hypothetical protein
MTKKNTNAGQILDVFSTVEISEIIGVLKKLPINEKFLVDQNYIDGFQKKDLIYPYIKEKVLKKLEVIFNKPINLLHGMLLKEEKPWVIHTDYIKKDDPAPDLAIVIPLNTEEINTHTVVFNEECLDNFNNFILNNNKLENNAKNLYNNLCSHEDIDRLEYVSLLSAYKWHPGSIIYWDRKLLHCSDNFLKAGIKEKTALVIFTTSK